MTLSRWTRASLLVSLIFGVAMTRADDAQVFQQRVLDAGWQIRSIEPTASLDANRLQAIADDSQDWLSVKRMPAMVHDVLLDHGRIETPWLPGRAAACQWVADRDWIYMTRFDADPGSPAQLRFQGLDTIVDVYLNGRQIASHCNMYTPLCVDVSGKLRNSNALILHFHSVFRQVDGKRQPIRSLGESPLQRVRRPKQNYGSYLGPQPSFSRVGVYDDVVLEMHHGHQLTEVVADADLDESLEHGSLSVDLAGVSQASQVTARSRLHDPSGQVIAETEVQADVQANRFSACLTLSVHHPQLWWPRGYGDQSLYRLETSLMIDGRTHQTVQRTVGFRRVTMPQPLHFQVNNVPVRWWGGDWVTPHWRTAVWDPPRVDRLIAMAEHANFNAFRVWGVVESPRDDFYERADAQGFMLWQDFTDLPLQADDDSREICRREAEAMIKRLKHHPSIFVWCGGNENAMWNDKEFNGSLEDRGPWPGLAAAEDVGRICRRLDPDRYYQPSTPYGGIDPNDPQQGNTHGYTNMWYVPGYDYLNFASEDTRIAAPVLHSLKRFMAPEDLWPADYSPIYRHGDVLPYPETWRKYTTGSSWKKTGPVELFYDATNPAELVRRLGMAEALYYQDVIERQRRGRDATDKSGRRRCGGYLVWKFNDSWPHIYSGKVDYFLEPYHVYYTLRRAYAPVMLSFDKGDYIYLWAVNDSPRTVRGTVRIQLFHLDRNQVRAEIERDVQIAPGQSKVVVRLDEAGIGTFRREHILNATLADESGQVVAQTNCFGDIERRMTFPDATLDVSVEDGQLLIRTDKFARCVTLEGDADGDPFGWFFADNYFDVMPGEEKRVGVLGQHDRGTISVKPCYSSKAAYVSWQR